MNDTKYITDSCFVLTRTNSKDNDAIITIYGKNFGKQTIIAKGVQKASSKFSSLLNVANCIEVELVKGKSGYILMSCSPIDSFRMRFDSYESILTSAYICELVDKQIYSETVQDGLFELLETSFNQMNNTNFIGIKLYFEWAILALLGYGDREVKDLPSRLKSIWRCTSFNLYQQSVSDEAYVFLSAGSEGNPRFSKMYLSMTTSKELTYLFEKEIEEHLQAPIKSRDVLKSAVESYFS